MRTPRQYLFVATMGLAVAGAGGAARAQSQQPAPPPASGDVMFYRTPGAGPILPPGSIGFLGVEAPLGGKVVTGVPFTASFSTESVQTLADGNRIQHKNSGTLARDAQGRTRRDMSLPAIGAWTTSGAPREVSMINDPVSGVHYVLEHERKIAREFAPPDLLADKIKHGQGGIASTKKTLADSNVTTASLGTQTIGGVPAEGTRITHTIPADAIGNKLPITVTVERWYSADLQTDVMIKRSDPRSGDTIMQLCDIVRQVPDASLFQVPSDYTVEKGGRNGTFHLEVQPQ
jgi:hypothetical protein